MATTKKQGKTTESERENLLRQRVTKGTLREMVKAESKRATIQSMSLNRESCRMYFDFEELP